MRQSQQTYETAKSSEIVPPTGSARLREVGVSETFFEMLEPFPLTPVHIQRP